MDTLSDPGARSDQELGGRVGERTGEEREISPRRRLPHAKTDILCAQLVYRLPPDREQPAPTITGSDLRQLVGTPGGRLAPARPDRE
jgi:hypothetical protein